MHPDLFLAAAVAAADQKPLFDAQSSSPSPLFTSLERLARIVDVAYCVGTTGLGISAPFNCISRCRDFPELSLVDTFSTGVLLGDTCGYVAVDRARNEVLVAFRGTYSLTNTVEDLRTVPQEYVPYEPEALPEGQGSDRKPACHNCTVHAGFYDSWKSARPLVLPTVEAALNSSSSSSPSPPMSVHLVGHSLGGAVAALAGLEMRAVRSWDVRVTTFGEPRIGNAALVAFIEDVFDLAGSRDGLPESEDVLFRRVTHRNDPVPLLPLAEWGFRPHTGEIYIDKADLPPTPDSLVRCRGRADPSCSSGPAGSGDNDGSATPFPRLQPWELLFAHRDYFWRLGLCVPGGDPSGWAHGQGRTNGAASYYDEL